MKTERHPIVLATAVCTASVAGVAIRPNTTLEPMCQSMVDADMRRNQSGLSF